jgi:capsule biosynthesis phosphatase
LQSKKNDSESYSNLMPINGAVEAVQALKNDGHYIIIYTARRMKTHNGNLGRVLADVGSVTLDWLSKFDIPYDEVYFGKPWADIYIDDNAYKFKEWNIFKFFFKYSSINI